MAEHRPIRSFVLRQGRVSNAQRRAHETLMPKYGIPFTENPLDLEHIFRQKRAQVSWRSVSAWAKPRPLSPRRTRQYDYLAVEVHTPGVGSLLKQIEELGLTNIRVIQHDVVEVLQQCLPPECLDGVHIFFPDPWPKARHHKRRLIQPEFIALLCRHLKPGGYIHAATDWEDYADQILEVLSNEPQLANTAVDYASRPEYRPLTKFEQRGLRLGHGVWDLVFRKK